MKESIIYALAKLKSSETIFQISFADDEFLWNEHPTPSWAIVKVNLLSYGLLPIAHHLIFLIFFPSTTDVSILRSGMSQYFRSSSSLLPISSYPCFL